MEHWVTGSEELTELWALNYDEIKFLSEKPQKSQLDFAYRIKHYTLYGKFPRQGENIPFNVLNYIADQIDSESTILPNLSQRVVQLRNAEIKKYVAYEKLTDDRMNELQAWLTEETSLADQSSALIETRIRSWCISKRTEPPSYRAIERMIATVHNKYEFVEFSKIAAMISSESKQKLESSIRAVPIVPSLLDIKADPGRVGRDNFNFICEKLKFITDLNLPKAHIRSLNSEWIESVIKKMARFKPAEIRRFNSNKQIGMYAIYLIYRIPEITDSLIEMLIDSVHKIEKKAISTIEKAFSKSIHNVYDRERLLVEILTAVLKNPDYPSGDLVFPLIGPGEAEALIEKYKSKNRWVIDVFNEMHGSWKTHYRSMLKNLLDAIEFCSNVAKYKPIIDALNWIKLNFDRRSLIPYLDEKIPIEGVVPKDYQKAVIRGKYIDRHSYELCTLITLREKLRCREIWVHDSVKFKNPDDDIPEDFEERRLEYYDSLNIDIDTQKYVAAIKAEMEEQLIALDYEFPRNKLVGINNNRDIPSFRITPLIAKPEPTGLVHIKQEIAKRWPMTGLLDMLKESALDTAFTKAFQSVGYHQRLSAPVLNKRLILTLYGLGTNAGLKRVSAATNEVSYENLRHIRRRFIDVPSLREANQILANSILGIRDPAVWGEMGTATASDSKQYKAWDQNPMSEYHARYGGRGVMIYWHVEARSMCIYSQLKKVSSREAASMIQGILNHCSDMSIDRHYVDTHGQTEVAFAFSRLLSFELAPRIKRISHVKLFSPTKEFKSRLPNVGSMLVRQINWKLINRYFDEMVKYTTAMKEGKTSPEIILRRFARSNNSHPTYKALSELGRAIKTIFVCRYLRSVDFRREIQEGLNVMENWNSATNFVHFGRGGEITSNRREDQEIAVQALHLLQNCMVYVNTQMYQNVLSEEEWRARMSPEDYRGITPLIYNHVNPYGRFDVNLAQRMPI